MLLVLEPAVAMTSFPLVNKDLGILRFVAQRARLIEGGIRAR